MRRLMYLHAPMVCPECGQTWYERMPYDWKPGSLCGTPCPLCEGDGLEVGALSFVLVAVEAG